MMCLGGHFELIVSPALLRELEGVLLRAKFRKRVTKDQAREFVARLGELATNVPDPRVREAGLTPDPKDDYLVALAHASGASCLVSGDAHIVELDDPDPPVMTPRAFFDMLEGRGS